MTPIVAAHPQITRFSLTADSFEWQGNSKADFNRSEETKEPKVRPTPRTGSPDESRQRGQFSPPCPGQGPESLSPGQCPAYIKKWFVPPGVVSNFEKTIDNAVKINLSTSQK